MSKFFKNGIIDGDELYYHDNGKLAFEKHWDEGIEKGKWDYFYSNGQIKKTGQWKDGLKDGKWEHYLENGNKTDFVLFSKGRVWMVLEFDRFGVVKSHDEEIKFNEMLKNKSSIEASETRKGRRKLKKQKAKEKKKLNKSKKQKGDKKKRESK